MAQGKRMNYKEDILGMTENGLGGEIRNVAGSCLVVIPPGPRGSGCQDPQ